ncbi:cytochrome P450 89A2-like [Panicum miliaceum]|uniref:Cytochrome P450 89A2-like n=1 Tax=Panicum miliaceum TaxID=4540 RepID=A0A3L6RLQ5_PANMI|nr:cytochrome P450 89A2-like [Panicum miliaceum]
MEDWLLYTLTTLLCLLCLLLLRARARSSAGGKGHAAGDALLPLPPGPTPLPLVGPLLFLLRRDFDLQPVLRRIAREHGPVFTYAPLGKALPTVFVASRGAAHRALVQRGAAFASRPVTGCGAVVTSGSLNIGSAPYGATWRALRRNIAAGVLNPSRLRAFSPARRRVLGVLASRVRAAGGAGGERAVAVMDLFQYAVFCLLVYMCFGDRVEDTRVRDIEATLRELLGSFHSNQVFSFLPALTKVVFWRRWEKLVSLWRRQEELFLPLVQARREAGANGDCYVDSILKLTIPEDGGRALTDVEIASLCSEFLAAGTESTATALQWILANLVKYPAMQDRLRDEVAGVVGADDGEVREEDLQAMPYLKAVVLEGLRRHPPGHYLFPHAVHEDTTLDGYRVPAGALINFAVGDIGLDEEVWDAPLEFRPERFLPGGEGEDVDLTGSKEIKMMPFGAGRRVCPGMAVALLHLEYFVANLVREFQWCEADGEEVDLTEKFELNVVMKRPLKVKAVPLRRLRSAPAATIAAA